MGFQRDLAATLAGDSDVYRVIDTTLIPAVVGVRACRKELLPTKLPSVAASSRPWAGC